MKTLIFIAAFLSAHAGIASGGEEAQEKFKTTMTTTISEQLSYRDITSVMGEGFAFAEISIDECGRVKVLQVNASSAEKRAIIQSQLETLHLNLPTEYTGKTFAFKLEFHKADS